MLPVVVSCEGRVTEVALRVRRPDATVADLASALGLAPDRPLTVDGRAVPSTTPLGDAGLVAGSVVSGDPPPAAPPAPVAVIEVFGGLAAGWSAPLAPGAHTVGRERACDVVVDHDTVSSPHCRLTVAPDGSATVADLDSTNGTWVDEQEVTAESPLPPGATLRTGAVLSRLERPSAADRAPLPPARGGRVAFNRPPRVAAPPAPSPLAAPKAPATPPSRPPFSFVALLAPLGAAAAMVAILGDPRYAVFALLSPVMVVGTWIEGRRRTRRARRTSGQELAVAMARFHADLARAAAQERERRIRLLPDPAEAARRARLPAVSLWQRRAGDPELLALHLGTGAPRWPAPLAEARDVAAEAAELAAAVTLPATPVGADLVGDGALGLVGDRAAALAVARSLVCQAATHAGPSDLRIAVVAAEDRRRAWAFTGWLPHRSGPVATDAAAVAGVVASLPAGDDASSTLLVVDGEPALALPSVRRALEQPRPALILAATQTQLPASCRVVVEVGAAGDAELRRVLEGSPPEAFLAAGTGVDAAARWARDLARFGDPRLDEPGRGEAPHAAALLGPDAFEAAALAARWSCPGTLTAPVGVDDDGVVPVELGPGRPHVAVAGPPGPARGDAVRTLVAGLAAAAPPGRLSLVLVDAGDAGDLDALAPLPHCRLLAGSGDALRALRAAEAAHVGGGALRAAEAAGGGPGGVLVVVLDGARPEHAPLVRRLAASPAGLHLVVAAEEGSDALAGLDRATEVRVGAGRGALRPPGAAEARPLRLATLSRPDGGRAAPVVVGPFGDGAAAPAEGYDLAALVAAARQAAATGAFSPAPPLDLGGAVEAAGDGGLPSLLGLGDLEDYDPAPVWAGPRFRGGLAVPIGAGPDGRPLVLDLKEAALGGMGPHGLVAGATGSGKSEALRALVLALALTHPPEELSFVLVDFKGGATFAGLAELPHVAGMITNLESDPALVDRMRDALGGEQRRRQALLRDAGNLASLRDYHGRRRAGAPLAPLPSLLVVVDEFAELLAAEPEFVDVFVSMGRVGRSLGVHLLLASQRLEEGRLRGLESHLSYRIALRTFSAAESRTVLGVPDAYDLPNEPGWGYLKVGTAALERFRSAYVGAPTRRGRPLVDAGVEAVRDAAPRSHQVWLPPLGEIVTLDQVPDDGSPLAVPVGLVDRPQEQAVTPLVVELAGRDANLAVVGAPRTGKSTLLRTLLVSLLRRNRPGDVHVYAIDFGGGGLAALEAAPHVGTVAGRLEPERVRRVVAEMQGVLAARERLFTERGVDSAAGLRALPAAGADDGPALPEIFLVIDNWPALRLAMEALEPAVVDLAARGLGYGIHVVLTANRWIDVRPNLRDSVGGRLELRLNDPADSLVDRRASQRLTPVTGRGLTPDKLQFQAAVPRLDGVASTEGLGAAVQRLAGELAGAWDGPRAPAVRMLPSRVGAGELPAPGHDREPGVPIGVAESDLAPVYVDLLGGDPHFVAFGDGESGKTTFLRTLIAGLAARIPPAGARFVVVDYRRTLLDAVPEAHLLGYAGAAPGAVAEAGRLREVLTGRLPPPDLTPAQLRDRSWWSGPEIVVVVDDYDLVVTPTGSPLAPLADFLAQGRDLGLHLVLARRAAGASRALFEPVLQRVRDLGSPGLLLSGDRGEGPLLGPFRPADQPPGRGVLVRRRAGAELVQVATPGDGVGAPG